MVVHMAKIESNGNEFTWKHIVQSLAEIIKTGSRCDPNRTEQTVGLASNLSIECVAYCSLSSK